MLAGMTAATDTPTTPPELAATVAGPPGADGLAAIEVAFGLAGGDRILVNGHDVSRSVLRTSVHVDRSSPAFPVVVLELRTGAAEISGPGVVQILPSADDAPATLARAVAEWIADVDPNVVDQALLQAGMGSGSPGQAALAVLAALAARDLR